MMNGADVNYNPFSLRGKTVLITGASSGIGRVSAIECSRMGASLMITGRDEVRLKQTFELLHGSGHRFLIADLASTEHVQSIISELPLLDGVVLCAGINKRIPLKMIKPDVFEQVMRANLLGQADLVQKLHKHKRFAKSASIVFISSVASKSASLGNIMYMTTKGAMNSFMKGIAFELAAEGIRANAIQPGMIQTRLSSAIPEEAIEKDLLRYPLRRYGKPEEVAYAVVYLLSDASLWMTGAAIDLDGGLMLQ